MTNTQKPQSLKVTIETPEELLQALASPKPEQRVAILRAIASAPGKALQVGREEGFDLVGELLRLYRDCRDEVRAGYVYALLGFADPRCLGLAREEFLASTDSDVILLTARRLAELPAKERIPLLTPALFSQDSRTRSRAAANLLADCRELPPAVALRVALLSDHGVPAPPVSAATLPAWLGELEGPYPRTARRKLLEGNDGNLAALMEAWDELTGAVRQWALEAALKDDPDRYADRVRQVLREGTEEGLLLVALEGLRRIPPTKIERESVVALFTHPDPSVRAAAVLAGDCGEDWSELLVWESVPQVRIALLCRLGERGRSEDLERLAEHLATDNWRVRAAATGALVSAGPAAIPLLRQRSAHPEPAVRAAVIQALTRLGEDPAQMFAYPDDENHA